MSLTTKILVVLLTVGAIFLCGTVVNYVGNAEDYKQQYDDQRAMMQSAKSKADKAAKDLEEFKTSSDAQQARLEEQIASLKQEMAKVNSELNDAKRTNGLQAQEIEKWTSTVESFTQTNESQRKMLDEALAKATNLEADTVKLNKKVEDLSSELVQKMAVIDTLETDKKRLVEQKTELQAKLDDILMGNDKRAVASEPVTLEPGIARKAEPIAKDIELEGRLTNIDPKNSMASLSIGSADGVREGMTFHVTRGQEFVCDVVVISVEPEEAVGILELVQSQPRVGDVASTNL